ncbi:MAG: penicillin-binding protein activator [Pseudomonadota bacterium]
MFKLIYKSLFFTLLIVMLFSCSETPKQPEQKPDTIKEITNPTEQRLQQAHQRFALAMKKTQPEKNRLLLDIVDFLFEKIPDLSLPGSAEYSLITDILKQIDINYIIQKQYNRYLFSHVKVLLSQQQYEKADVLLAELLEEDYSGLLPLSTEEQIEYHDMRVNIFINTQQPMAAVKELIMLYQLTKSLQLTPEIDDDNPYLNKIWEIMNTFQLHELEQQIATQTETDEKTPRKPVGLIVSSDFQIQLIGWQQLIILVKMHSQQYQLIQQLALWSENFPQHMANHSFILNQLQQRFELLINPQQIALLLPGQGKLAKPSQVIINGFLASHYQQAINDKLVIRLYDTSEYESIWPSYKKAIYEGADIVIGPFQKKHITELSQSDDLPVTTLALNNIKLPTGQQTENLFQFALTPEDEVNIITQSARQNGLINAALITPDSKWGKRLELAFVQAWEKQGGMIVGSQKYPPKTYDYSSSIKQLLQLDKSNQRKILVRQTIGTNFEFTPRRRQDIDVIFLAAFPKQAKQIPLQISYHHGEDIPIYATSHIIGKAFNKKENTDLNGITYTDMPWLLNKDLVVTSRLNRQKRTSYQRLFAFGVDSYQIIPYLQLMKKNTAEHFSGNTGIIHITEFGYIKRQVPTAKIVNGKAIIVDFKGKD